MPVFLLDTDMLSLHQRNQSRVVAAVDSHAMDQLCVSTVTIEEQIGGWSALARLAKTPQVVLPRPAANGRRHGAPSPGGASGSSTFATICCQISR
jgi:hypothetical protein